MKDITTHSIIHRLASAEVEAAGDRRCKFTVTTDSPDRERDIINPAGVVLDNFLKNPIIPWAHDYHSLPIGRAVEIQVGEHGITMTIEFATADLNPLAEQVYRMVKAGFIKATSVGFRPLEWSYNEERRGVDFHKIELLEVSVVPVPANAEALIAASAEGKVDLNVVRDWAQRTLKAIGAETRGEGRGETYVLTLEDEAEPLALELATEVAAALDEGAAEKDAAPSDAVASWRDAVVVVARLNQGTTASADMADAQQNLRRHYIALGPSVEGAPLQAPFDRDAVGWRAYEKAAVRARRKAGDEPLTDAELAELLADYGFDEEAGVLREDVPLVVMPAAAGEPAPPAGEEEAELVGYRALASLLGQAASGVSDAQAIVAALVGAEAGEGAAGEAEDAEAKMEAAQLAALKALCFQAKSTLVAVCELADTLGGEEPASPGGEMLDDDAANPINIEMSIDGRVVARAALSRAAEAGGAETKIGRVLSRSNEGKLRSAAEAIGKAHDQIELVLASVEEEKPAEQDAMPEYALALLDDEQVLALAAEAVPVDAVLLLEPDVVPAEEPALVVDAELVGAAVRGALTELVRAQTTATINALRGRID